MQLDDTWCISCIFFYLASIISKLSFKLIFDCQLCYAIKYSSLKSSNCSLTLILMWLIFCLIIQHLCVILKYVKNSYKSKSLFYYSVFNHKLYPKCIVHIKRFTDYSYIMNYDNKDLPRHGSYTFHVNDA